VREGSPLPGWHSPEQAWAQTQGQLAWYRAMMEEGEMTQITDGDSLEKQIKSWSDDADTNNNKPIGFILSLEGADSLVKISYLEQAYGYGLRALGPAHYGEGRYAGGTGTEDGFSEAGKSLLKEMDSLHMILDVTHLTDTGFKQAMEIYKGPVWASHHNCRTLVKNQRQLTDDQIKILIERGAVIGGVLDAWMLADGWIRGVSLPRAMGVNLNRLIDHYDHICQIAGNSDHIAIGSDLDGAFGTEQSPFDLNTISDLQKLPALLTLRGYADADIEKILHGNWLRFLRKAWN
jgi:membrane dipeptidase